MKVDFKKKGCKDGKWILYINIAISQDEARENSSLTINLTDPPKSKDNQLSILRQEFDDYCAKYSKADMRIVKACKEKFVKFLDREDKYSELDKSFCEEFWNYLTDSLHGNTPANYFKKFRTFLDNMVEKGIIQSNPTKLLKLHYSNYIEKEALSTEEIKKLLDTPCRNNEVKKAFLFSCFCGLRWCDMKKLEYCDLNIVEKTLSINQQKTKGHSSKSHLHTYLNNSALGFIDLKKTEGVVFGLPCYCSTNNTIKKWAKAAGITKKVTFHCARHTFVSSLIEKGVDLKTVADLAGHSSTRHTERYVHNTNHHLRESINKISVI